MSNREPSAPGWTFGVNIKKTEVYQEGDRIRIREGVFEGLSTSILKVDRRCKRMLIEIPLIRQPVRTWVEYEIVEREKTE